MARVELSPSGCLVFSGKRDDDGYGRIWDTDQRRTVPAHRAVWEDTFGSIPPGKVICHRCDNPPCVLLDHLFIGTNTDNVADRHAKQRDARGSRQWKSRLTAEDVRLVRQCVALGAHWSELAPVLGVAPSTLWNVATGKTWRWVA